MRIGGGGYNIRLSDYCIATAASIGEKEAVISICDSAFGTHSVTGRNDYAFLLDKIDKNGIFIYAHGNEVNGYAAFYANDVETKMAYITLFAVREEYQRKRIGTALMQACCDMALSRGLSRIELEVRADNAAAIAFYGRQGYKLVRSSNRDTLYMAKELRQ